MGDRSPKDKQKKKQQHDKEAQQKNQHKQENMTKNRHTPVSGAEGSQDTFKKAG